CTYGSNYGFDYW
nr:immunoglobulin heavy chain junction region [Macaca mulatta]MOX93500.1 immunoglobulin heavy chain junction region [Macaca mulatta]MOX94838.1 immunoglobulin heavy chain junction region [Macaca mulatta]MOX96934.1 immunoglobulin heavy chain junction region [Macaca mulatta]